MRRERIRFQGAMGGHLAALLDLPEEKPIAFVLFAHCFTCSKDLTAVTRISYELNQTRMATFRFDITGLGHSDGEFANTNFSSNVQDLIAAADYLRTHHEAPRILIGHSLGGTAVLASAKDIPEAKAVATIGAPFEPAELMHLLPGDALEERRFRSAGEYFTSRSNSLRTSTNRICHRTLPVWARRFSFFTVPMTKSCVPKMPIKSTKPRSILRVWCLWMMQITFLHERKMPNMSRWCFPPGRAGTSMDERRNRRYKLSTTISRIVVDGPWIPGRAAVAAERPHLASRKADDLSRERGGESSKQSPDHWLGRSFSPFFLPLLPLVP